MLGPDNEQPIADLARFFLPVQIPAHWQLGQSLCDCGLDVNQRALCQQLLPLQQLAAGANQLLAEGRVDENDIPGRVCVGQELDRSLSVAVTPIPAIHSEQVFLNLGEGRGITLDKVAAGGTP